MNLNRWFLGLAATAFVAANLYLIRNSMNDGVAEFAHTEDLLRKIDQNNAELDAAVLSLRLGLVFDYDELARSQQELRFSLHRNDVSSFQADPYTIGRLQPFLSRKVRLASEFKSLHSITRNSLSGFSVCLRKSRSLVSPDLLRDLERVEVDGLRFATSGLEEDRIAFRGSVRAINPQLEDANSDNRAGPLQIAMRHAENLIRYREELDATIERLVAVPISPISAHLMRKAKAEFQSQSQNALLNRIGLVVSILFAVGYCGFQYVRLRQQEQAIHRANATLEEKVARRTAQLAEVNQDLQVANEEANKLALVARYTDNGVVITDIEGKVEWVNHGFEWMTGHRLEDVRGKGFHEILFGPETSADMLEAIHKSFIHRARFDLELTQYRKDGKTFQASIEGRYIRDEVTGAERFVLIGSNVSNRVKADAERLELYGQLVKASRMAGMAEVATGVLHNVGNVLNSVNVSASMIQQQTQESVCQELARVANVLQQHESGFADFVASDKRGEMLPNLISQISNRLEQERSNTAQEIDELVASVNHIREIISAQQSAARTNSVDTEIDIPVLLDRAIKASAVCASGGRVQLKKQIDQSMPTVLADEHKVLQILINLIGNAKDSIAEADPEDPEILLKAYLETERLIIEVQDSGVGIRQENLSKIFQHGFTTKAQGHGFGLHTSANFATEIGGALSVSSEGEGKGASFRLSMPLQTAVAS